MSLAKIGAYTGGATAVGATLGGISNEENRLTGALKGGLMGGGLVAGSVGAYKGLSFGLEKAGYKGVSDEVRDNYASEFGRVFKSMYGTANSKAGLEYLEKQGKGSTLGSDTVKKNMDYFSRKSGAMAQSANAYGEAFEGAGTGKLMGTMLGATLKDTVDFTNKYTVEPGMDFAKNLFKGNFRDMSVNQGTSFASNAYGTYAIGQGIYNQAGGEEGAFSGGLTKAMVANGLQMKGSGLYNGVKAYYKSGTTLKGLSNTYKFAKYSNSEVST